MKIKQMKYFKYVLGPINGVNLFGAVVIATKIKPGENLTGKISYRISGNRRFGGRGLNRQIKFCHYIFAPGELGRLGSDDRQI